MKLDFDPTAEEILHAVFIFVSSLSTVFPVNLRNEVCDHLQNMAGMLKEDGQARIGKICTALQIAMRGPSTSDNRH